MGFFIMFYRDEEKVIDASASMSLACIKETHWRVAKNIV